MPAAFKGTLTGNPVAAAWQAGHSYTVGALVQPTSPTGQYFQCQENGTSAGSEPLWYTPLPVPGSIYPDNTTQWFCMGSLVAVDGASGPNIVVDIPIDTDSATTPVIARALKNLANYVNAFVALVHTWTVEQFFAPTSGNTNAIQATGNGNGTGVKAIGGSSAGYGIDAYGGAGQAGGQFTGGANSYALVAIGGSGTGGQGIIAQGTGDNEAGNFTGGGTGEGIVAVGGSGGAVGVIATGTGGFVGLSATSDTGDGLYAQGAITSGFGNGVTAQGGGTGAGIVATGGPTGGDGIAAQGGGSDGIGGVFIGSGSGAGVSATGGATKAPLHLTVKSAAPSGAAEGDLYSDSTTHKVYYYDGTTWQALF